MQSTVTRKVPYQAAFFKPPSEVMRIRSFCYEVLYHLLAKKLATFVPRLEEGIHLLHDGSRFCLVIGKENTLTNEKEVRMKDSVFPAVPGTLQKSSDLNIDENDKVENEWQSETEATESDPYYRYISKT